MTATITRIPVPFKRGRKVTKGPRASLTVIYELKDSPPRKSDAWPLSREERIERMAERAAKCMFRRRKEAEEYEAWLDSSPTVSRFPAGRRYRNEIAIERLKAGLPEDSDADMEADSTGFPELDAEMAAVCTRRDEILARME